MRNQSIRLYLYSSVAIVALTLIWGFRAIPKQADLARSTVRASIEQEIITMNGAVKAATQAVRFRLLDVLKAEGQDHTTRTFQNSPFMATSLFEWDQAQWKMLWHSSKAKTQFAAPDLKVWMHDWPLAKLSGEESFFVKVGDWQGQPYYAIAVPVRKPNNVPMIGVGIFPANQFGMVIPADRTRDVKVFDDKGFAIALGRAAYLGSSVKREAIVEELLESGEAQVRADFKNAKNEAAFGMAAKVPTTNLAVSIESALDPAVPYRLGSWLYLIFAALGALGLNWFMFFTFNKPVLTQLAEQENIIQQLRKRLTDAPADRANLPLTIEVESEVADKSFVETVNEEVDPLPTAPTLLKSVTLQKVVQAALKSMQARIQEYGIQVAEKGLQSIPVATDALQLQTAIEEVLKNAIEAMQFTDERWLTISATSANGRVIFTIEDTGSGVPAENLSKVFDPFYSTKDSQGVARGLGLNVARRVVEEMKGRITIDSHQGPSSSGTTLQMEWPLPNGAMSEMEFETRGQEPAPAMIAEEAPVSQAQADAILSDLDLLADEYEIGGKEWPEVVIRKPIVRNMD
jgi:anti-sigma regulatory factor (Ser/Thr protein kinase)